MARIARLGMSFGMFPAQRTTISELERTRGIRLQPRHCNEAGFLFSMARILKAFLVALLVPQTLALVTESRDEPETKVSSNKITPFGRENTAGELQDRASKTQDTLVDAVENAEVAEIKRAVFRALTRLRAATIKEFDTIARLETQSIDAYNDAHHYRHENPLSHLHEDEAPVQTDKLTSFH